MFDNFIDIFQNYISFNSVMVTVFYNRMMLLIYNDRIMFMHGSFEI